MALLPILHYPDKRLYQKAQIVNDFSEKLQQLIDNMAETMYTNNGIGLAATQVNVHKRLFIMDLSKDNEPKKLEAFINPSIIQKDGSKIGDEGCLSVPGIYESVVRAETITLSYQDINGNHFELFCDGLRAICIQHEIDHLDGKVFVDYLSNLKQNFIKKKMKKLFKE